MKVEFDTNDYVKKLQNNNNDDDNDNYFYTFLNRNSLAAGIIFLKPGQEDTQEPHDSDEVYYVVKGDGYLKIKNKDYRILPGKSFFVRKDTNHYFFGNTKDLVVLYFFGGPDS